MAVMGTAAAKLPPVGCSLLPRTAAPEQTKSQDLQPGAAGPGGSTGREKCMGKRIGARPLSVDFGHNVEQHRHERWSDGHLSYIHLFTRTPSDLSGSSCACHREDIAVGTNSGSLYVRRCKRQHRGDNRG